jgi:hypothetical protein
VVGSKPKACRQRRLENATTHSVLNSKFARLTKFANCRGHRAVGETSLLDEGKAAKQRDLHEVHQKGENDRAAQRAGDHSPRQSAIAIPAAARTQAIDVSKTIRLFMRAPGRQLPKGSRRDDLAHVRPLTGLDVVNQAGGGLARLAVSPAASSMTSAVISSCRTRRWRACSLASRRSICLRAAAIASMRA